MNGWLTATVAVLAGLVVISAIGYWLARWSEQLERVHARRERLRQQRTRAEQRTEAIYRYHARRAVR